jgi:hypothetical protein
LIGTIGRRETLGIVGCAHRRGADRSGTASAAAPSLGPFLGACGLAKAIAPTDLREAKPENGPDALDRNVGTANPCG